MKSLKFLCEGVAILALLAFGACTQEESDSSSDSDYAAKATIGSESPYFTFSAEGGTIYFKTEGGSVVVNVDCGTDWTIRNTAEDLFATTLSSSTLTVTAKQNTVEEDQTGTIIFYTAKDNIKFATIVVTQDAYGAPEIYVETNEWHAPAVGKLSAEIGVKANADWTAEVVDTWLTVGKADAGLVFTAEENKDTTGRSTKVTLVCTDGIRTAYEYINVSQDGKVYLTLSAENVIVAGAGYSAAVSVESNHDWYFSYDAEDAWYTISRDGDNLTITSVVDNETEEDLQGIITVTAGDGEENVTEAQINVVEENAANALILVFSPTEDDLSIALPLAGTVDCSVNWGDGNSEAVTSEAPTHTYASAGSYTVIVFGTVTAISGSDIWTSLTNLTAIEQWGKTGLTSMSNAFLNCKNLKSIPGDPNGAFADVTTFERAFYYCSALKEIPENLFAYADNVETFNYTFYYCSGLTSLPEGLFDHAAKATSFEYTFSYCTQVKSVPETLFEKTTEVTSFEWTFAYCSKLGSIPAGLFSKCTKVTSFFYTFTTLSALTEIPADLFANNKEVETFCGTFVGCSALTTVPKNLFANCSKATIFQLLFYGCTKLESIGEGAFSGCSAATTFHDSFYGCTSLSSLPGDLFADCTAVTDFSQAFYNCTALTSLPANLFSNCINATDFQSVFYGCTKLANVGAGVFSGCSAASTFYYAFYRCTSLVSLPDDLFADCSAATNFSSAFYRCTALASLPNGLFADCSAATTFYSTFNGCTALASLPEGLFANCKAVTTFTSTFNGCTGLTGESAYDVVELNGEQVKVHLYDRADHTDAGYTAPTDFSYCYNSCTGLSDYDSISKYWGGGYSETNLSAVLGTYTAKGYVYSDTGVATETTWTLKIYESFQDGYDILIDGLVPMAAGYYPGVEAYIAQATYSDGKFVIPAQLTGYIDFSAACFIGWYPCSRFEDGYWYRDPDITDCTFTYDSATDTWTSDYGEFLAGFNVNSATASNYMGFFSVVNPGIILTRTSTETSTASMTSKEVKDHTIDSEFMLHTDSMLGK